MMDPQDETRKNDRSQVRQGLENDRLEIPAEGAKLSWDKGDTLTIDFILERGNKSTQYEIEEKLPVGGFAQTYKALNLTTHERFVLKFPLEALWRPNPQGCKDLFQKEAEALKPYQEIDHPNLVKFIALGHESVSKMPVIVMNYIFGSPLNLKQGQIREDQTIAYIRQISSAVKLLHKSGKVHRDISPKNVIVREESNHAVLLDLGISRSQGSPGTSSGTPGFAPPEQFFCESPEYCHDVYALARLLKWLVPEKSLSQPTSQAIEWVIRLDKKKRMVNCPTVDEFLARLPEASQDFAIALSATIPTAVSVIKPPKTVSPQRTSIPEIIKPSKNRDKGNPIVSATMSVLIFMVIVLWKSSVLDPPVPLITQTYQSFEQTPFNLQINPELWKDETPDLDKFRDRTITKIAIVLDSQNPELKAVLSIEQYRKTSDWSWENPYAGVHFNPKDFKEVKTETLSFRDQSVLQVSYQYADYSLQGRMILFPLEEELYLLFYEASPDIFDRYSDRAWEVFQSIQFNPQSTQPRNSLNP